MANPNKLRDCDSPRCREDADCDGLVTVRDESPTPQGPELWEYEKDCGCRCHIEDVSEYDDGMSIVEELDDDTE